MSAVNTWNGYFHGEYRAARAWLFLRVFPCMVALDAWMLMIGHAGRYGVDGFNVAQFRWLDRIAPLPSASMYIAVLLLSGLAALCVALGVGALWLRVALFLLYTFSWSMSMLDSYQHHYFVSSVLLCIVFFPDVRASEIHPRPAQTNKKKEKRRVQRVATPTLLSNAFGYSLLGAVIGILYTYTSIAKMDAAWCAGATIQRISSAAELFAPMVEWTGRLGLPAEKFWSLFATSVIPLELLVACGYVIAVRQDAVPNKWLARACLAAFFLAMTLHLGAEAMELEIGWFSYYMLLLACVFLLPGRALDVLARTLTWPARALEELLDFGEQSAGEARLQALLIGVGTAIALGVVSRMLDLPGAEAACGLAGAAVIGSVALAIVRGRAAHVMRPLVSVIAAAALMLLSIARSEVRWDFYRYLGGDLSRRNQPEAALEAYERGERYAPAGESRMNKIRELREKLGNGGK